MKPIKNSIDMIASAIACEGTGIPTGFQQLDEAIMGLGRGEFTLLAARPSLGKSAIMLDMATEIAREQNVGIFSLEMSESLCYERIIAAKQKVSLMYDLKSGKVKASPDIVDDISKLHLWVEDSTGLNVAKIYDIIKAQSHKFDVLFIDYLQLIRVAGRDARYREIDELCQNLRDIAKKENFALVVLAQLNRDIDNRPDHRPRLSDLRESGGIEQVSDKILFLHRPSYYAQYDEGKRKKEEIGDDSEAYIIIAKNRNGRLEDIPVVWYGNEMHFEPCKFQLAENQF